MTLDPEPAPDPPAPPRPFRCPYCEGRGYVNRRVGEGITVQEPCLMCGGSGSQ